MTDRLLGKAPQGPEGDGAPGTAPEGQGRLVGRRYRLMSPVGRGGMGMVWHAHDVLLDRDVAVKELILPYGMDHAGKQVAHQRMLREARSAARLSHPGIVTVHDVVEEDGRPWIVMELVRAWSLEQAVRQSGPLPVVQTAEIGVRVLDALRHAHAAGIMHRDVKPGNVLLTSDRVVLTDFGIAAIEGDSTITQAGMLMGSPAYIPPERLSGQRITQAADLWSFGATLYAAVEGRPPYEGSDSMAVLGAILTQEPDPPATGGRPGRGPRGTAPQEPRRPDVRRPGVGPAGPDTAQPRLQHPEPGAPAAPSGDAAPRRARADAHDAPAGVAVRPDALADHRNALGPGAGALRPRGQLVGRLPDALRRAVQPLGHAPHGPAGRAPSVHVLRASDGRRPAERRRQPVRRAPARLRRAAHPHGRPRTQCARRAVRLLGRLPRRRLRRRAVAHRGPIRPGPSRQRAGLPEPDLARPVRRTQEPPSHERRRPERRRPPATSPAAARRHRGALAVLVVVLLVFLPGDDAADTAATTVPSPADPRPPAQAAASRSPARCPRGSRRWTPGGISGAVPEGWTVKTGTGGAIVFSEPEERRAEHRRHQGPRSPTP